MTEYNTFTKHELVTICFGSTVSTRGSDMATFLMQLMSKPYTLSHPEIQQQNEPSHSQSQNTFS